MQYSTILRRWLIAGLCAAILAGCSSTGQPLHIHSFTPKNVRALEPGHGYLLMAITTNQAFDLLQIDGPTHVALTQDDLKTGTNYVLISLQQGQYNVSKIRRILSTYEFEKDDYLSFDITPGTFNYIGDLQMEFKGLPNTTIKYNFVNRSSFALEFLQSKYSASLKTTPALFNGFGSDRFLEIMTAKNGSTETETSAQGGEVQ